MRTSKLGPLLLIAALACKPTEPEASEPPTILAPYLALGETLAADSTTDARARGDELVAASRARADQPGASAILAAATQLPGELEPARTRYRAISQGVLEYLDAHPDERAGLTLVYCPMTFKNEGAYWVQRDGGVDNPYEGSRMRECGAKLSWEEGQEHRARWAEAQAEANADATP